MDATAVSEFGERCYRFSVRCDRETNRRIAEAAAKAGLSPTSFVQRHFETILDGPEDGHFCPRRFARRHDVSEQAARLWQAMAAEAGADGEITAAARDFCRPAGIGQGIATECLAELIGVGLVRMLRRPASGRAGTYRINAGDS